MTIVPAGRPAASLSCRFNSVLKCALATLAAVKGGGATGRSSVLDSGDLPMAGGGCPFRKLVALDLREPFCLGGVTPPTPCREFIEAFRSSVGVEERASTLIELELRRRGLFGARFAVGEEA